MSGFTQIAKRVAANLPDSVQQRLKVRHFARQMRRGRFVSPEPEFSKLSDWVSPGDFVIDVGANVGHYTAALSNLVGNDGRVISAEPVPQTFALLTANMAAFGAQNVTLVNAAISSDLNIKQMSVPNFGTGLKNYYEARITDAPSGLGIMTMPLDNLVMARKVRLIKIDTEGHEMGVLEGARKTIQRDLPLLIVETETDDPLRFLEPFGYGSSRLPGSPNVVFSVV